MTPFVTISVAAVMTLLAAQQCIGQESLPTLPELPPPPPISEPLDFDYEGKKEPSMPKEDRNGDGLVTKTEMLSYWNYAYDQAIRQHNPERYFGMLALFESDNNGIVTRKEILAYYSKLFKEKDTNRDGTVSLKEKLAYEKKTSLSMECGMPIMALEAQDKK